MKGRPIEAWSGADAGEARRKIRGEIRLYGSLSSSSSWSDVVRGSSLSVSDSALEREGYGCSGRVRGRGEDGEVMGPGRAVCIKRIDEPG